MVNTHWQTGERQGSAYSTSGSWRNSESPWGPPDPSTLELWRSSWQATSLPSLAIVLPRTGGLCRENGRNLHLMIICDYYYAHTLYEYNKCGEKIEQTCHCSLLSTTWINASMTADLIMPHYAASSLCRPRTKWTKEWTTFNPNIEDRKSVV